MTLHEFLEESKRSFADRGTFFMIKEIDVLIDKQVPCLEQVIKDTKEQRNKLEVYSNEYMYLWSVMTYLESMNTQYQKEHTDVAV